MYKRKEEQKLNVRSCEINKSEKMFLCVIYGAFLNARRSARVCAWKPALICATEREDPQSYKTGNH
jgi:hypothetical protein